MSRQDYAQLLASVMEHRPCASTELLNSRETMNAAIDTYLNEVELDTFLWAFELGRAWERRLRNAG